MPYSVLVDYLQTQVGDALRGVVRYYDESVDLLYLRDDVRAAWMQSQFDRMVARVAPETHAAEERSFPFGDLCVTVRRFADAIIMHFPTGSNKGVIVSLDPETARDLTTFTTEWLKRIRTD